LIGVVPFFFLRLVMADRATCRGADNAVMTRDMTGYAADGRAFKAALGVGWGARQADRKRESGATQHRFHWQISVTAVSIRGAAIRSRQPAAIECLVTLAG
jgi:hypothetical protein